MRRRTLWRLARDALLLELALYRALGRWSARRPDVPTGTTAIHYGQLVVPMLWLWIFGSATEVVVVEVVLRHVDTGWAEALRLPLLVIGVWGVLWMLGLLAAHRVRPHLLDDERLLVRSGARTWVAVPRTSITQTRTVEHELPGIVRTMHLERGLLLIGVGSRTNVEIVLTGPTVLNTSQGAITAERVGLWVDAPREVGRQLTKTPGPVRPAQSSGS